MNLVKPDILETGIFKYESVLSEERCQSIIESLARNSDLIEQGAIAQGTLAPHVRRVFVTRLDTSASSREDVWWELGRTLWKYSENYRTSFQGLSECTMEGLQALHYVKGDGHYEIHHDGGKRMYSAVLYLNTVEQGGETEFVNHGISVSPRAGTLIMFPAWHPYAHRALPPLSEDKFAVVTWWARR